jgi:hypothetical protein
MHKRLSILVLVAAVFGTVASAEACPVCDRATGRQVRAGIFDRDFAWNLGATVLPVGIFFGLAAAVHGGPRSRRGTGHFETSTGDACPTDSTDDR